jgi:hypothetical protein
MMAVSRSDSFSCKIEIMPKPLLNKLGKRQPRALVVGLRRVVKDPRATVAQRLKACELLAIIEGYVDGRPSERNLMESPNGGNAQNPPSRQCTSPANQRRLRELLEEMRNGKLETVSPGACSNLPK